MLALPLAHLPELSLNSTCLSSRWVTQLSIFVEGRGNPVPFWHTETCRCGVRLQNPFVSKEEPKYISERLYFSFGLWNTYKLGLLTVIPKHKTKSKVTAYVFVSASPNYLQMYSNTI